MPVLIAGLLLLLCVGCGGDDRDDERFRIYHLETAIGPPENDGNLRCGPPRASCPGVVKQPPPHAFRYAVRAAPAVTGKHIDRSTIVRATDPDTGRPVVIVGLTAQGRKAFARLTKEAARVGGRDQAWHHIVVVVGDEIVAYPEINFDAYPDGVIDAPAIEIPAASDADARDLVRLLGRG